MQLFFDLDGTLIDSSPRLFRLFCDMCPECRFSYGEYCAVKRNRVTQAEFLKRYFRYGDDRIAAFHEKWLAEVEDPRRMLEDRPFPGITEVLMELARKHALYIVTNRQSKDETAKQIRRMGWEELISELLVTERKSDKVSLAAPVLRSPAQAVWTGDTGEDMKAAKALSIPVVAVSWGVISPELLAGYHPDALVGSVSELRDAILRLGGKNGGASSPPRKP